MASPHPPVPDRDAWCLHLDLPPDQTYTSAALYPVVSGVAPDHGAKPLPMFWDHRDATWWSLSPTSDRVVSELVWTVDLVQLHHHPKETHRPFLEGLVAELRARVAPLGGKLRVEESVSAALQRMARVVALDELRGARISIDVVPPEPASVRAWWEALEGAGMTLGDGDLFWADAHELGFPEEFFEICAEPLSAQGYFHPDDLDGKVTFPDVTVSFRIIDAQDPEAVLPALVNLAERVAEPLGARLLAPDGAPWSRERARALIERVLTTLGPRR